VLEHQQKNLLNVNAIAMLVLVIVRPCKSLLANCLCSCNPNLSLQSTVYSYRSTNPTFVCPHNIYPVQVLCPVYGLPFLLNVFDKIIIKFDVAMLVIVILALRVLKLIGVKMLIESLATIGITRIAVIVLHVIVVTALEMVVTLLQIGVLINFIVMRIRFTRVNFINVKMLLCLLNLIYH
jgi:hypothetical protein